MSFKRKIAYNTAVQILGKVVLNSLLSVALVFLLARYLGPKNYGFYSAVIAFGGLFAILADFGIYPILIREMASKPKEQEKIFGKVLVLRLLSAFLVCLLAFLVSFLTPYPLFIKWAIGIVALQSLFASLTNFFVSVFQLHYQMDLPVLFEVLGRAVLLALVLIVVHFKLGFLEIFWFLALSSFLNLALLFLLATRYIKIKPQFDLEFFQHFLRECWPVGIVVILLLVHFKTDTIILSLEKSAYEVGLYGAAYRIIEVMILIPLIFSSLLLPKFSEFAFSDQKALKQIFQKAFDILFLFALPLVAFLIIFAPQIIVTIAGIDFVGAIAPLRILVLAVFWPFLYFPIYYLLVAARKQKALIFPWGAVTVLNIALNLILIPKFSYKGAAFATFVTEAVLFISAYFISKEKIKIAPDFILLKRSAVPAILTVLIFAALSLIPLLKWDLFLNNGLVVQILLMFLTFGVGFVVYILLLLVFRIISKQTLREILIKAG